MVNLDFSQNYLESVFPDIKLLVSLDVLNFGENLISEVTFLAGHKSLKEVNFSCNRLKNLSGLENLPSLVSLNASNNYLTSMDTLDLPNLKKLDLSCN